MSRYDRSYFAGRYAAQEALKEAIKEVDGVVSLDPVVLVLVLPMPISVNEAWTHVGLPNGGSRAVLTAEHREYRSKVMGIVHGSRQTWEPMLGRLRCILQLNFRDHRITDIDNRVKSLWDALAAAGVMKSDSQFDELHVRRVVEPGCDENCYVTIEPINPGAVP